MRIEPLGVPTIGPVSLCIVLSGHAVHAALGLRPTHGFVAIGRSTAAALRAAVDVPVAIPARSDSEGVIAWLEDHPVDTRSGPVLVLTGEGGREVIERYLHGRAIVHRRINAYRRQVLPITIDIMSIDVVEIASEEALRQVDQFLRSVRPNLDTPLLVVSERLATAALGMGFRNVRSCAGPEPAALVAALSGPPR